MNSQDAAGSFYRASNVGKATRTAHREPFLSHCGRLCLQGSFVRLLRLGKRVALISQQLQRELGIEIDLSAPL
jgi:hypothetical protein